MPTITLNVHSDCDNTVTYSNYPASESSSVKAEARRRLEAEDSARAAALSAVAADIRRKAEAEEAALFEQRVRLRAQEEKIRLMAERMAVEEAARKAVLEKENAVAAEIDRLRNRTATEKLQDQIDDLKAQIAAMRRSAPF